MKVKELVEKIKALMPIDEILESITKRNYISVMDKRAIALYVLEQSANNNEGLIQIDELKKELCFKKAFLQSCTSLEFSNDFDSFIEEYDELESIDALDYIFKVYFRNEFERASHILEQETKNLLASNSIDVQLGKFIQQIDSLVETLGSTLNKKITEFGLEEILPEDISSKDFIKMVERLK